MGVTSGVAHFFESIGEVLQGILAAIVGAFRFVLSSIANVFKGVVNFVEGTLGFAFHNFFILGTLTAVVLGYMLYTQQQRRGTATTIKS
ncbi:hypothetical protein E0Z10_g5356 [Xylaria hypoxylon]|uniref:Uncharacterized protein n=1 Tax=Xylaria hypoxylon TaxID=37992 RepID=A0A4Z0YW65_9PEZI|nr:hypothetical protein E0Z10_g5356 [Xylaria hypoxylon]